MASFRAAARAACHLSNGLNPDASARTCPREGESKDPSVGGANCEKTCSVFAKMLNRSTDQRSTRVADHARAGIAARGMGEFTVANGGEKQAAGAGHFCRCRCQSRRDIDCGYWHRSISRYLRRTKPLQDFFFLFAQRSHCCFCLARANEVEALDATLSLDGIGLPAECGGGSVDRRTLF